MANDKQTKLAKYVDNMKDKLTSAPPAKHTGHPDAYYDFVKREIQYHTNKLNDLRVNEPAKK